MRLVPCCLQVPSGADFLDVIGVQWTQVSILYACGCLREYACDAVVMTATM